MKSAFGVEHLVSKGDPKMDMRSWESRTAAAKRPGTGKAPGAGLQDKANQALGVKSAKKAGRFARMLHR